METAEVAYMPSNWFAADDESVRNKLRLCFGYNTVEEIGEGIERLADAFRRRGVLQ